MCDPVFSKKGSNNYGGLMKKIIIICTIIGCLFVVNYLIKQKQQPNNAIVEGDANTSNQPSVNDTKDKIVFHIKGAIKNPGVYEISNGSYLQQAIDLAGGLLDANLSCLNLAQVVIPYQEINIPYNGEDCPVDKTNSNLININTASKAELTSLKGVGDSKAEAIIKYRQHTPFIKIEDLKNVEGISEKLFNNIKDQITV